MNKETLSSDGISGETLVNYVNRVLNLGLDVHYRQVTVAMQEDGDQGRRENGAQGFSELGAEEMNMKIKTRIQAGKLSANHSETLVRG